MARLPQPGGDKGNWGDILNDYLSTSLNGDGSLKNIPQSKIIGLESDLSNKADTSTVTSALNAKAPLESPAFTGTPTGITKAHVGLGLVNNTSDTDKPVSAATLSALNMKLDTTTASASYAPITGSTRHRIGMAVIGDSISSYEGSGARVWHRQLSLLSNGKIRHRGFMAVGGYTLEQIETNALPQILALDPLPEVCVIAGGTNNTGSGSYNRATSLATHARIRATLEAAGITPAMWLLPPRSDSTLVNSNVDDWNATMAALSFKYGYPVVDAHAAVIDSATGGFASGMLLNGDAGVHPSAKGHLSIAQYALNDSRFISFFTNNSPDLATRTNDVANIVAPGLFIGDSDSNGLADGWGGYGTINRSLTPATYGNWQRTTLASGSTSGGAWRQDFAVAAGHVIDISCRFHVDMDPASPDSRFVFNPEFRTASASVGNIPLVDMHSVLDTYGMASVRLVVPATATLLRLTGIMQGPAPTRNIYGEISQVTVRDLTALGIA